ncbi:MULTISPECIES: hypothetical protein [Xanthobacter]|nr:hypothetical protein [Xanthobacter autotrophicus]
MSFSVTLMDLAGFAALLSWGIVRDLKLVNSHVVAAAAPNP